jgi:hypothetical protein
MHALGRLAAVVLAALALSGAPRPAEADAAPVVLFGFVQHYDGGHWVGGESDPAGWVLATGRAATHGGGDLIAYLDGSAAGLDPGDFARQYCVARGIRVADALSAGGVETPRRSFALLKADLIAIERPTPPRALRNRRSKRRIEADLELSGVIAAPGGTDAPSGGLSAAGRIDGGRFARVLALDFVELTPEQTALNDLAFLDLRGRRYWARLALGAMTAHWVGPFPLPRSRAVPAAVVGDVRIDAGAAGR